MSYYSTRLAHFDYVGEYRYALTLCTINRRAVAAEPTTARETVTQLQRAADATGFAVPVYVLMPDHMHVLAVGRDTRSDLRQFIHRLKQFLGYAHHQRTGQTLWQRSVWDRVLRHDVETFALGRYMLENPVRAGLVTDARDWQWSGSLEYPREIVFEMAYYDRGQRLFSDPQRPARA